MSLFLKRKFKLILFIFVFLLLTSQGYAYVYVYEVVTALSRFQTASKLPPDAFLFYNGGYDVIYSLQVVAVYGNDEMEKALKDYNLEKNNSNKLLFKPLPRNIPRKPYYWWR